MDFAEYSLAGWLGFAAFMLIPTMVFFVVVVVAEGLLWTVFPPPKGSRFHKDNLFVVEYKVLVGSILFVVAAVLTIQLSLGVIEMPSMPSF